MVKALDTDGQVEHTLLLTAESPRTFLSSVQVFRASRQLYYHNPPGVFYRVDLKERSWTGTSQRQLEFLKETAELTTILMMFILFVT